MYVRMVYIEYAQVNVIMTSCCCWPPRWNHCALILGKRIPLLYKNGFILFIFFSYFSYADNTRKAQKKKKFVFLLFWRIVSASSNIFKRNVIFSVK